MNLKKAQEVIDELSFNLLGGRDAGQIAVTQAERRAIRKSRANGTDAEKELRRLAREHKGWIQMATAVENRTKSVERGPRKVLPPYDAVKRQLILNTARIYRLCAEEVACQMEVELRHIPIWREFLSKAWYCGPILSSYVVSMLDPEFNEAKGGVTKATTFTRFCGLAVVDGGLERGESGKPRAYSVWMRTELYKWAVLSKTGRKALGCTSKYLDVYDRTKARFVAMGDEEGRFTTAGGKDRSAKNHGEKAGVRDMARYLLEDLYLVWRAMKGLPVYPYRYAHLVKPGTVVTLERAWEVVGDVGSRKLSEMSAAAE